MGCTFGLKTLDRRDDLETYGDWARVDVRQRRDGFDAVVVYVHDKAEIDTPAFRKFAKQAADANLRGLGVPGKRIEPVPNVPLSFLSRGILHSGP